MALELPYEGDREFSVFVYLISHGLLLLRSGKSEAHPTRVDILFQDVRWIGIPGLMNGVRIERGDRAEIPIPLTPTIARDAEDLSVYRVISEGVSHCLLASRTVSFSEDEMEFFEASPLLPAHDLRSMMGAE